MLLVHNSNAAPHSGRIRFELWDREVGQVAMTSKPFKAGDPVKVKATCFDEEGQRRSSEAAVENFFAQAPW